MSLTYLVRTEPRGTSGTLEAGFAARLGDPLWMLGRQWQLGELLGEDAGSPVGADLDAETATISRGGYLSNSGSVRMCRRPARTTRARTRSC